MSRSIKKGPYVPESMLRKLNALKSGKISVIKTWCRACVITPEMVGCAFQVHNGKQHIPVSVSEDMVGHRLGEFSPTTKFGRHGGKMQKGLEAKSITPVSSAKK